MLRAALESVDTRASTTLATMSTTFRHYEGHGSFIYAHVSQESHQAIAFGYDSSDPPRLKSNVAIYLPTQSHPIYVGVLQQVFCVENQTLHISVEPSTSYYGDHLPANPYTLIIPAMWICPSIRSLSLKRLFSWRKKPSRSTSLSPILFERYTPTSSPSLPVSYVYLRKPLIPPTLPLRYIKLSPFSLPIQLPTVHCVDF